MFLPLSSQRSRILVNRFICSKSKKNHKDRKDRKKKEHQRRNSIQPKVLPSLQNAAMFPPLVPTAAPKVGPIDKQYSYDEIVKIVHDVSDLTCPPLATPEAEEIVIAKK